MNMHEILTFVFGFTLILSILTIWVLARRTHFDLSPVQSRLDSLEKLQERLERGIKEEILGNREENSKQGAGLRQEVVNAVKNLGDSIMHFVGGISKMQEDRLNGFSAQLGKAHDTSQESAKRLRDEVSTRLSEFNESTVNSFSKLGDSQKGQFESFSAQLEKLTESNEKKFEALRLTVENKLSQIQNDNEKKLEEMRQTVDEKLQGTLEKRLGQSFKLVSERLEEVHKGLGEMQKLAVGVGDLKKVLTNVKSRGDWGEVTVATLLEEVLTAEQFERNLPTKDGSNERVEFAVKLPGIDGGDPVLLPIDAKFPKEDYERLLDAYENGDRDQIDKMGRELEKRIKDCAKELCEKHINPPRTTDFALMFLATEGLYAEVVRRPGLVDSLQRNYRIVLAGPTTFLALLNSLRVGFRTLAIQKCSSEVWMVLGDVKTEFGRFENILKMVKKKLQEASNTIEKAEVRTRVINRKLKRVEALPKSEARTLPAGGDDEESTVEGQELSEYINTCEESDS